MLKHKQAGIPAKREHAAAPPPNVINLMDALRRSIAGERVVTPTKPAVKKGRKRVEGQREMLLPLPGKRGQAGAAAKPVPRASGRQKKAG